MHDLWWGRDGALYATVSGWTCDHTGKDENAEKRPAAGSSVWKLVDDRWVRDPMTSALGDGPITMARHLGEGEVAVLSIPDCVGRVRHPRPEAFCRTGPLYRVVGGVRTKVADGVIALSAGPAGPRVPPGRGGRAGQVSR